MDSRKDEEAVGGSSAACAFADDDCTSGDNSAVHPELFYSSDDSCEESELDSSMADSEARRCDTVSEELSFVQEQVSNVVALSMFFERKLACAIDEGRNLRTLRLRLLYRNLAAALLGRLIARTEVEFSEYNTACKAYVRRLLQLQDRKSVTSAAQKILNHLQSKLKNAPAATIARIRRSSRVSKLGSAPLPLSRCK